MTVVEPAAERTFASEIVPTGISGGTNTSHTIVVAALTALLDAVPADAPAAAYEEAAIEATALGKATDGSRRRTFRYLRELYLLRPIRIRDRSRWSLKPLSTHARSDPT